MVQPEKIPSAEQKARDTLERMAHALAEAKSAADPKNTEKSLLEVFPEPGERRTDTAFTLPPEQEVAFRNAMAKLGIGRETTINATELGLQDGYVAVIEGGLGHKIAAELSAVLSDETTRPSMIVVAATPDRMLPSVGSDKAKEREYAAQITGKNLDEIGDTEYEVARQIVESIPGFNKQRSEETALSNDPQNQQFIYIGSIGESSVVLMPIIREPLEGDRYRQPGTREVLKTVHERITPYPDVGFVTSSTYQPSREIDAANVVLELSREEKTRHIGVITYGMGELAAVKGEPIPQPPALGQLAGEAYKATQQVEILRILLSENQ